MKTKVIKRVVALALAALILLGTLGYFFSMVGYAAETSKEISNVDYKVGETTVKPITNGKEANVQITFEAIGTTKTK